MYSICLYFLEKYRRNAYKIEPGIWLTNGFLELFKKSIIPFNWNIYIEGILICIVCIYFSIVNPERIWEHHYLL